MGAQDFYTQADSMKAAKHFAPPPPDAAMAGGLAGAARSGKRILVMAGGVSLLLLALYVMWPRVSGVGHGYAAVEETEHFVTVSGTQVRGRDVERCCEGALERRCEAAHVRLQLACFF